MSLPRIRLERCKKIGEGIWALDREQERHLTKALRVYEGAAIEGLLSADEKAGEGEEGKKGGKILLRLERAADGFVLRETARFPKEPETVRIFLLIGLLKADQFDAVLRSAAELELAAVLPVVCAHSVPRFTEAETTKKIQRWQRILDEGSKVSGAVCPPAIHPPVVFGDLAWGSLPEGRYAALLSPRTSPLSKVGVNGIPKELVFAVGPEGDWTEDEAGRLLENAFVPVGLGHRVLRASTAALVGCGWFRLMAG